MFLFVPATLSDVDLLDSWRVVNREFTALMDDFDHLDLVTRDAAGWLTEKEAAISLAFSYFCCNEGILVSQVRDELVRRNLPIMAVA